VYFARPTIAIAKIRDYSQSKAGVCGEESNTTPLKTTAWEARILPTRDSCFNQTKANLGAERLGKTVAPKEVDENQDTCAVPAITDDSLSQLRG